MNWDRIEGTWKQIKGNGKQHGSKLIGDQVGVMAAWRDNAGRIQESYCTSGDGAEKKLSDNALKTLAQCVDVGSLGSELRTLCSEFGSVSRLDILTMIDAGKRHAVCLLRLDSTEQEQHLMAKLGASRFGEDLCVVVDLRMPDQAHA